MTREQIKWAQRQPWFGHDGCDSQGRYIQVRDRKSETGFSRFYDYEKLIAWVQEN